MKPQAFVVMRDAYARALNVVGEHITVLAPNEATGGYEVFLQQGEEGSGPPPHSHGWDESFYVTRGCVDITYGDQTIRAMPGTFVHLPAGTVHGFHFGPGGGEMISIAGREGKASKLFATIDRDIPIGEPDVAKLIAIAGAHGVSVAAPPGASQLVSNQAVEAR